LYFWAGGTPTPQADLVFFGTGILPVLKNGVTSKFSFLWNRHLACSEECCKR
jgi:hypothetical protein